MNQKRRNAIDALIAKLEDLKSEVEAIRDEEQEYFDAMPESLQGGDKGTVAEEAISSLEEAAGNLDSVLDNLSAAVSG